MQFKAKDGSMHPNQKAAYDAGHKTPAPSEQNDGQGGNIESDPEAMQAVDLLKQKGYTADDVAQAMGDDQTQQDQAPQASPLQIPGMQ